MQILDEVSGGLSPNSVTTNTRRRDGGFALAYEKAAAAENEKAAEAEKAVSQARQDKAEAIAATRQALLSELHDYLKKSPAEHIRDAVLKELGLSEESLAAMPPEQRAAMEAKINERIREKLLGRKPEAEEGAAGLFEPSGDESNGAPAAALRMALANTPQAMLKEA
ncbi:MAG: hypothetical protein D3M94_17550 [Rhodocyclales bacterium GT-UBC]|nr:MAG: hypothetical protein D3M94_17550 [Rhodocyclales bacterium GT-UBC]